MLDDELLAKADEVAGYKVLPPCAIYARIGAGGMGNVYKGRHLNLDIDVAVKVMKPELVLADPQFVARFRREGQSAAKIGHQNVIRVFDVAEAHDLHYLIMEFVQGETARQRVERKGPLAIGEALQIVHEAALGLGAAHKLGIVHRDVKPDNLLVSIDGEVKVADLGLAKPAVAGRSTSMLSSPNQIMGTPCYMPPEQWEGAAVTAAADVWALGATLWFLLVGREAISGDTPARIMSRIVLQPFPDVRELRPGIATEVVEVLTKATAKEPADRYPTANELAEAIDALAVRRATLRDQGAGSVAPNTMLSPPPLQHLEQVKSWLRDGTRSNTPVRLPTPARGVTPDGTVVRPTSGGSTVVRPSTTLDVANVAPPRRSPVPLAIAATALLGLGGGAAWWFTRPTNATSDAEARIDGERQPTTSPPATTQPAAQPTKSPTPSATEAPNPEPNAADRAATTAGETAKPAAPAPAERAESKPVDPPRTGAVPPPAPFAEVDRLLVAGELDAAIRAAETLTDAALAAEKQQRLAAMHARKAGDLQRTGRLREALDQLAKARAWLDSSTLQQQRRALTDAMARSAGARLLRVEPIAPIVRSELVGFFGKLAPDYDVELRLGGEAVPRSADGSFAVQRRLGAGNSITVAVAVEDSVAMLEPWRVEFLPDAPPVATTPTTAPSPEPAKPDATAPATTPPATPKPTLAFVGELNLPRLGGQSAVRGTTLRVTGKLSERDAALLVDDKPIDAQWQPDGTFQFTIVLPAEGRNRLTLRACKNGLETTTVIEAARITQPPVVKPATPSGLATRVPQPIAIAADEWTSSVKAKVGNKTVELKRDGDLWRGDVPLESGKNTVEITATNLADLTGKATLELEVRTARLAPGAVRLVGAGEPRKLDPNQTVYVGAAASLEVAIEDGAWLLVDGQELPARASRVPLALAEGESRTLRLQACNGIGRSGPFTLTVVQDGKPAVITPAQTSLTVKPGAEFEVSGTWTDPSGVRQMRIDGKPAIVDKNGTFRLRLPAPAKDGTVKIVATDGAGNVSETTVQVRVQGG